MCAETTETIYYLTLDHWSTPDGPCDYIDGYDSTYYLPDEHRQCWAIISADRGALIAWANAHTEADDDYVAPVWSADAMQSICGPIPDGAVAHKSQDPTEPARWVYDEGDYREIAAQDERLLSRVVGIHTAED